VRCIKSFIVGAVLVLSTVTFVSTPAAAAVTPAYVQGTAAAARSGVINNISFDQPIRAADVVVVYAVWDNAGAVKITDSQGSWFLPATPRTTWANGWSAQTVHAWSPTGVVTS
jgi:hypothetical protein